MISIFTFLHQLKHFKKKKIVLYLIRYIHSNLNFWFFLMMSQTISSWKVIFGEGLGYSIWPRVPRKWHKSQFSFSFTIFVFSFQCFYQINMKSVKLIKTWENPYIGQWHLLHFNVLSLKPYRSISFTFQNKLPNSLSGWPSAAL